MFYADVNILSGGTHTKNKNTRALLVSSKAISQEAHTEKITYMVMFRHQHVLQIILKSGAIQIFTNKPNALKLHSWTNQRWNEGNTCFHSVQNILSSSLLSKTNEIKIHGTVILLALYGCDAWVPHTERGTRLKVLEHGVLKKTYGPKKDEVTGKWGRFTQRRT